MDSTDVDMQCFLNILEIIHLHAKIGVMYVKRKMLFKKEYQSLKCVKLDHNLNLSPVAI